MLLNKNPRKRNLRGFCTVWGIRTKPPAPDLDSTIFYGKHNYNNVPYG